MDLLHQLQTDYTAEIIAATQLTMHGDVSRIIIERLGINGRSHSKDQYRTREAQGFYDLDSHTIVQTFRQGIYDMLPESLFHPPTLGGLGRTPDEIIAEIRHQRRREADARQFFKPFEQEPSYLEMQALLTELMLEQKAAYPNFFTLFAQAWPVLSQLPQDAGLAFIYVLPILHRVRGNRDWTARCMSFVTGLPVRITVQWSELPVPAQAGSLRIGATRLGINSSLRGQQYDGISSWKFVVGPVTGADIESVLPHTGFMELLELLADHLVPAQIMSTFHLETEAGHALPSLNSDAASDARLGYSFYL